MLLAILGLYFVHGRNAGEYTFDYMHLLGTVMAPSTALWLMLGFLAAFLGETSRNSPAHMAA